MQLSTLKPALLTWKNQVTRISSVSNSTSRYHQSARVTEGSSKIQLRDKYNQWNPNRYSKKPYLNTRNPKRENLTRIHHYLREGAPSAPPPDHRSSRSSPGGGARSRRAARGSPGTRGPAPCCRGRGIRCPAALPPPRPSWLEPRRAFAWPRRDLARRRRRRRRREVRSAWRRESTGRRDERRQVILSKTEDETLTSPLWLARCDARLRRTPLPPLRASAALSVAGSQEGAPWPEKRGHPAETWRR